MPRSTYDGRRAPQRIDITPTVIYVGYADYKNDGVAPTAAAAGWTIKKITLTGGNPTNIEWSGEGQAIWDNRSTETYH